MTDPTVAIRGSGVAASCCAHLLRDAGFSLSLTEGPRPRIPALLIGEPTQALLRDLYRRPDLFDGLFQIDRRVVAWGPNSEPVELPHRAAVISEAALLDRLGPARANDSAREPDWTIYASRPLPTGVDEHAFGFRTASATAVTLKPPQASACFIESLEGGWLFLIPESSYTGWLISVGGARDRLLAHSRLIAPLVDVSAGEGGTFAAYPRMIDPLCAWGWLACGTAAMTFDPLCGDGTGNAVRESILAAAVIRAAHAGDQTDRLVAHYRTRLIAGMSRHLELCRSFYASANCGPWWQRELEALDQGIEWCRRKMGEAGPFRYRLQGLELQNIGQ
jgi:hypothetical protein